MAKGAEVPPEGGTFVARRTGAIWKWELVASGTERGPPAMAVSSDYYESRDEIEAAIQLVRDNARDALIEVVERD